MTSSLKKGRASLAAPIAAAAWLVSGCASGPEVRLHEKLVAGLASDAAGQVRRCYRTPKVASAGKQISTRLRVRFQPDGSLLGVPMVVAQSGVTTANQAYAGKLAEAAGLAVVQCAPLRLPPELHARGWDELEFIFSYAARA